MELKDLIIKNRSYRRFYENEQIPYDVLLGFVEQTRYIASARNAQPLKYIISNDKQTNEIIFPYLAWAAYLQDWKGPKEGERPSAYIIVLLDKEISKDPICDHGIAAQTILLLASEKGYGGCIVMSIQKEKLHKALNLPEKYEILMAIALGKPKEKVIIESMPANGDYKYWRTPDDVHHVPKRSVDELIFKLYKK